MDKINEIRGKPRGGCGDNSGGGNLIDNIINEADPYLTAAKTWLDGTYEMYVGTPGRRASMKKAGNGTTHTTVSLNNAEYAEYTFSKKLRESEPDLTEDEVAQKLENYKKGQSGGGDSGNLVADHTSYAGNYTSEVHGDRCEMVDGTETITIEGDYHLDITGNCHISVGGGFFFNAQGAPQVAPKEGASCLLYTSPSPRD